MMEVMRRMATMSPNALRELVHDCAKRAPREINTCLAEYGPLSGMVRLAPLFPRGYLDRPATGRSGHAEPQRRDGLVNLIQELDRRLPRRPRAHRTSVSDARLDDIIFREVAECTATGLSEERDDLLEHLASIYDVAPRLPRLGELVANLRTEVDLSDAVVVAHQHVLGTVVSQFEALWELGLEPSRTYVIGKPYSTNQLAAMYLEQKGCSVRTGFASFDLASIFSPGWYQSDNHEALGLIFADVVRQLPHDNISRLIVLDDGGLILTWLNRAFDSGLFSRDEAHRLAQLEVLGVEQTTFGRHMVERLARVEQRDREQQTIVPIANVAQTRLKLEKETELIANSVVHELREWLRSSDVHNAHVTELRQATIGVIGFGVVGSWVCRALRNDPQQRFIVFDDDISHSSTARSVGYRVAHSVQELARECSVLIGCTGAPGGVALDASMLNAGTVLASASSGNYEFARVFITANGRKKTINPELSPGRPARLFDWVHSIFSVPVSNGRAFILNGGFPINFTGAVDPIRADQIELTRCLMLMGVAAGLRELRGRPNFGGAVSLARIDETLVNEMFTE
jgi:hypothetical protein